MTKIYEVEQKFRLGDETALLAALARLGAVPGKARVQVDCYYAHPSRDFAATDEALRIRRCGGENRITYKGPKLDRQTKTRREIELKLPPGDESVAEFGRLLESLGFRPVAEVQKRRRTAEFVWQGRQVEAALDDVEHVGRFVELETSAGDHDLDAARRSLAALAEQFGLSESERRSYLELLMKEEG